MPQFLQEQFSNYEAEYAKIKRGRKLAWMDHLGTVELEIELADRELTIEASPLQASILYAMGEKGKFWFLKVEADVDQLSIEELCRLTGTSSVSVKRAVLFWIVHGVVKEIAPETYCVLEYAEATSLNQCIPTPTKGGIQLISAITVSAIASASSNVQSTAEQAESEMQIYWYPRPLFWS